MGDKVVVVVEPPELSERLDIEDAFKQVLDFLRLVELAAGDDADFDWKLDRAETNSPFTVVAYSPTEAADSKRMESLPAAQLRAESGLLELSEGRVPAWMRKKQRSAARRLTKRFHETIGRVHLRGAKNRKRDFSITRAMASKALSTLEKIDGFEEVSIPAHKAFGEVEGIMVGVGAYYGKPALWLRVTGHDIVRCQIDSQTLTNLGDAATIKEVWENQRVRVVGELRYGSGGALDSISIEELQLFPSGRVELDEILDSDFTDGMEPLEYLERLHNGELH